MVAPDREQCVGVAGVFDPAHDQPGADPVLGAGEGGVGDLGDFGVGDPPSGVGIADGAGVADRGPGGVAGWRRWPG